MKIGDKINNWTVLEYTGLRKFKSQKLPHRYWLCECDCGVRKNFNEYYLRSKKPICCKNCSKVEKDISINIEKFFTLRKQTKTLDPFVIEMMEKSPAFTFKRSRVCDIGVNDCNFQTTIRFQGKLYTHPAYKSWHNMINRCYSGKHKYYKNVSVAKEWHRFSNFYIWWKDNHIEGYDLDKDLLSTVKSEYSPDTCIYIPHWLNLWIKESEKSGKFLPGFKYNRKTNKYCFSFYSGSRGTRKEYNDFDSLFNDWSLNILPAIKQTREWKGLNQNLKIILEKKFGMDILKIKDLK